MLYAAALGAILRCRMGARGPKTDNPYAKITMRWTYLNSTSEAWMIKRSGLAMTMKEKSEPLNKLSTWITAVMATR